MAIALDQGFDAIGADLRVRSAGNAFEIDVRREGDREIYQLQYPLSAARSGSLPASASPGASLPVANACIFGSSPTLRGRPGQTRATGSFPVPGHG